MTLLRDIPVSGTPRRGLPPSHHPDLKIPLWLPILTSLLALLTWTAAHAAQPDLSNTHLAGPRTLTGRACVIAAADLSGSMATVTSQRQAAESRLFPWLKTNLRGDDQVMLVTFTDRATTVLPLTRVDQLPAKAPTEQPLDGNGTLFQSAVTLIDKALTGHRCSAVELLTISDGKFGDDPDTLAQALADAGVTRMHVLNPNGDIREFPLDQPPLAGVDVRALGDSDQMSLTFGKTIADLTGQHLEKG